MSSKQILLIGCGQLGSRHLQALACLPDPCTVHVVDAAPAALELGWNRIQDLPERHPQTRFHFHQRLSDAGRDGDLCLIATQAAGRCALVKQAAAAGYRQFLIEKIVAQSVDAYDDLLAFTRREGLSVWVNCKTRAYGIHQHIKSVLPPEDPLIFSVSGGNHGLANNGVHAADLFIFHDGSGEIIPDGDFIDPVVHPSKRGPDIFDLSGMLCGHSPKGSRFMLSFAGDHQSPDQITIVSPQARFIVDHFQKFAWESRPATDWQWQPIRIDEDWMVSRMTRTFASEILASGACALPTLEACYPAHRFILNALRPHFQRLLKRTDTICPVT